MKSWYAATATVALMALATAGCQRQPKRPPPPGRPLVVADKLDCPQQFSEPLQGQEMWLHRDENFLGGGEGI